MSLRIGFYGFGAIGRLAAKHALEMGYEIVGAVDIDPNLVGKDVGELIGIGKLGVNVSKDPVSLIDADVVVHATGSYLDKVYPQLASLIDLGLNIVSTCETLSYPWYRYPILARKLDQKALSMGVTVLGSGINPGFILDTLIVVLAAPMGTIRRIHAVRSLDATKRREPFKKKIGLGMDPEEYKRKLATGELTGHVGYAESVLIISEALGLQPDHVEESQEPIVAEKPVERGGLRIEKGRVLGVKGYGAAYVKGKEVIRVELIAGAAQEDYEEITIESTWGYTYRWRSNGTPGDQGTVNTILALAETVAEAPPGLLTMADLVPFTPKVKIE
ncbi:MAG: dihydrodipicolinate reductase [Pyrodictiaceae archaeon]